MHNIVTVGASAALSLGHKTGGLSRILENVKDAKAVGIDSFDGVFVYWRRITRRRIPLYLTVDWCHFGFLDFTSSLLDC